MVGNRVAVLATPTACVSARAYTPPRNQAARLSSSRGVSRFAPGFHPAAQGDCAVEPDLAERGGSEYGHATKLAHGKNAHGRVRQLLIDNTQLQVPAREQASVGDMSGHLGIPFARGEHDEVRVACLDAR